LQCKAITSARLMKDKVDAAILAQLLRADLLPEAWIAPSQGPPSGRGPSGLLTTQPAARGAQTGGHSAGGASARGLVNGYGEVEFPRLQLKHD
jgi:hypothetical protein